MILKAKSTEDKRIDDDYAKSCRAMGSFDYLTDKELNDKYRKEYLGEEE